MMDSLSELKIKELKLLNIIKQHTHKVDVKIISRYRSHLKKIRSSIRRLESLRSESEKKLETSRKGMNKPSEDPRSVQLIFTTLKDDYSARMRGKIIRQEFLNLIKNHGIHLQKIDTTTFRNKSGKRVGIAVATERKAERWFLGLDKGAFDNAVLLCQRENGEVMVFCIPEQFFKLHGNKMSQSNNQIKFNVVKRGAIYYLTVLGTDSVKISEYIKDFSILK